MIKGTRALQINPPGTPEDEVLTREMIWPSLISKATHAVPFVKAITACRIIEHTKTGFVREATVFGQAARENIVLFPKERIVFERLSGPADGFLENIVEESDDGLMLRFAYELSFAGSSEEEERAFGEKLEAGYLSTLATVIDHARNEMLRNASRGGSHQAT